MTEKFIYTFIIIHFIYKNIIIILLLLFFFLIFILNKLILNNHLLNLIYHIKEFILFFF